MNSNIQLSFYKSYCETILATIILSSTQDTLLWNWGLYVKMQTMTQPPNGIVIFFQLLDPDDDLNHPHNLINCSLWHCQAILTISSKSVNDTNRRTCRYFWFKYDWGQKYYAPQVWPDRGSNLWPPDHDSTFHVTETPALTTRPSVSSPDN